MAILIGPILYHDPRIRKSNELRSRRVIAQPGKSVDNIFRLEPFVVLRIFSIVAELVSQTIEAGKNLRQVPRHIIVNYSGRILEKNQPATGAKRTRALLNQKLLPVAVDFVKRFLRDNDVRERGARAEIFPERRGDIETECNFIAGRILADFE